jgi:uncharacterized protein (DUF1697 family)
MELLRQICGELKFQNVRTYVQSGNLIFSASGGVDGLRKKLEAAVAPHTRLPVVVLLRTPADLRRIAAENPFLKEPGIDLTRLYITFLARPATGEEAKRLAALRSPADRLIARGSEVYLHCPDGYGRTKFSNNALERAVAMAATTRNWNTLNKLCELSA